MGIKVVISGPPRSGKSCFREGLKQALRSIWCAPYPYVITACPDGEGSWFQETVNKSPELANACKREYKSKFTPEFVRRVADSVTKVALPLCLIDIGGIPSVENEAICKNASHIIILAGDISRVKEWEAFAQKLELKVIAVLHSDYTGSSDVTPVQGDDGIYRGSVHYLERGEKVDSRPTIKKMAEILSKMCK